MERHIFSFVIRKVISGLARVYTPRALILLVTGCGDTLGDVYIEGETQQGVAEDDLGQLEQAVVGGNAVLAGDNTANGAPGQLPYGSSIRFTSISGNSPGFLACSGTKVGARRFLTAAHCVENWDGNGQVRVTNALDPEVPNGTPVGTALTVTQVYVHASWAVHDGTGAFIGRPLDVALFDVQELSSTIPTFVTPTINPSEVTPGWISRLVGYGSGLKAWGDNTAVSLTSTHPFYDEEAMAYAYIIWSGLPSGESGDSGAPIFNHVSGQWAISGVTSGPGPGSGESAFVRAETVKNWIANPTALSIANGTVGYLVNAGAPACLTASGQTSVVQWACCRGTSCGESEIWTLVASNEPGYFLIRNGITQRCLQPATTSSGAAIQQTTCNTASESQKWQFLFHGALDQSVGDTANGYSYYRIKSKSSGRCMSQDNAGDSQGLSFRQYNCAQLPADPAGHAQAWALTR